LLVQLGSFVTARHALPGSHVSASPHVMGSSLGVLSEPQAKSSKQAEGSHRMRPSYTVNRLR
jgi:hypothetical protein